MASFLRFKRRFAAVGLMLLAVAPAAWSQGNWPERPVRIIVPLAPGGSVDYFARLIAQELQKRFNRAFVIENRPGGGTTVGAQAVADAPPDGYTLLLSNTGANGTAPWLVKSARYDGVDDFTHVALIMQGPVALVANAKSPYRTFADVMAAGKSGDGIDIATSALGGSTHLTGILVSKTAGLKARHVPYRGSGPAQTALLAGEVNLMFDALSTHLPYFKAGTVRPLAVTSTGRLPQFPDTPTLRELGVDVSTYIWFGIAGPKGLPTAITTRLNQEIRDILKAPEVRKRYEELVVTAPDASPEQVRTFVREQALMWKEVVRSNKIVIE